MRPKNWGEFQHYKTRRPPWIKLHCHLANNFDFYSLPDFDAKNLVLIWIIASENENGDLPSTKELSFRLHITESQTEDLLARLSSWLEGDASTPLAGCKQDASTPLAEPLQPCKQNARLVEESREEAEERRVDAPNARASHAHCLKLQQELSIPASMGQLAPLMQLIDFEAQIRGDPERATDWLIEQGRAAKARGETVNVWWFTDKRYEGQKGATGGGNRKARTSGNWDALRNVLEELPEEGADGASGGAAGRDNRGNVEVIRPPLSKVRT